MKRPRLTYANVLSTAALFVALGGTGYAITTLPANSVGTLQIKAGAVNSAKVKNGSLLGKDLKAGVLPPKPGGVLPSHGTMRGAYGFSGAPGGGGSFLSGVISFPLKAPTVPIPELSTTGGSTAHCPGTAADPKAAAGYVCVYRGYGLQVTSTFLDNLSGNRNKASQFGVLVEDSGGPGIVADSGTWAYTAP